MQRDKRGRFVKGNTVAVGNKGNWQPKWGNKNAMKSGLYGAPSFLPIISPHSPHLLRICISRSHAITFDSSKGEWKRHSDGNIEIQGDKALFLEVLGMSLLDEKAGRGDCLQM